MSSKAWCLFATALVIVSLPIAIVANSTLLLVLTGIVLGIALIERIDWLS